MSHRVNRAYWTRTHYSKDERTVFSYREGLLADDRFQQLVQGDGLARVETLYQRAVNFHEEKVVVTISLACDQNEQSINKAAELGFYKALELVDDNYSILMDRANQIAQQGQSG